MFVTKAIRLLWERLRSQGLAVTIWWAMDHAVRILSGAPILRVSQITPQLHVGGQHRRHGWNRLRARGITAVVNMRKEFDDQAGSRAFPRYLYLPTVDDNAPSQAHLQEGVDFIADEVAQGGSVYVHCGSGIGRAATMAAAYLVSLGLTPEQAWARIRQKRPFIRPTPVQIEQLERFARQ